jgi:hypothetical protein
MAGEVPAGVPEFDRRDEVFAAFEEARSEHQEAVEALTQANQTMAAAKDAAAEARLFSEDKGKKVSTSRWAIAVAIAQDESLDPVKRAVWAGAFYAWREVRDPVSYCQEIEGMIGQLAERLQPGTPILEFLPDHGVIRFSVVQEAGLVTDLELVDVGAGPVETPTQAIRLGDITTPLLPVLEVINHNGQFPDISLSESQRSFKFYSPGHPSTENLLRIIDGVPDSKGNYLLVGQEAIERLVTERVASHTPAMFAIYMAARQHGIDMASFKNSPFYEAVASVVTAELAAMFQAFATCQVPSDQVGTTRPDPIDGREYTFFPRVNSLAKWSHNQLRNLIDAVGTTREQLRQIVMDELDGDDYIQATRSRHLTDQRLDIILTELFDDVA